MHSRPWSESSVADLVESLPCMLFVESGGELCPANRYAREVAGSPFPLEHLCGERPESDRSPFEASLTQDGQAPLAMIAAAHPFEAAGAGARLLLLMQPPAGARLMQELFDAAPEAMVITSGNRILKANREFVRIFGYTLDRCIGSDLDDLVVPDGRWHESEILLHHVASEGRASMESVRRTRSGEHLDVAIAVARLELGGDEVTLSITYRDIGSQKRHAALLQHNALHDGLTGLANRVLFLDRLNLTLARLRRRPDRNFAVVFLDVDRFKQVNDIHGHAAGDELLLEVAARLRGCVRPQDTVARFGGDEFALLLDEAGGVEAVARAAARIQAELQRPVTAAGVEVYVSASMGIALGSVDYTGVDDIIRDADSAMYRAKANGKARHEFFTPGPSFHSGTGAPVLGFVHGNQAAQQEGGEDPRGGDEGRPRRARHPDGNVGLGQALRAEGV
jgi:diguanylate cyclase (GGDEF)-like protein/PAS domain S-box-containing protein